jgi:hypothetical protein
LRYYDAENRRAGLPADVGALVRELQADSVTVSLANLSVRDTREVVIGAGSFGEHAFTEAWDVTDGNAPAEPMRIDGTWMRLRMRPGSEITLRLGTKRYGQAPTYAFPWHNGSIPIR